MVIVIILMVLIFDILLRHGQKLQLWFEESNQQYRQTLLTRNLRARLSIHQRAVNQNRKKILLPEILSIAGSVTVAWIAEYLIMQATITKIAFANAPFPPRDHYQYYIFTLLGGELFGRSYLVLATSIKPELAAKLVIHRLWF